MLLVYLKVFELMNYQILKYKKSIYFCLFNLYFVDLKINVNHGQDYLVANMKKDIQNMIIEGTKLVWESYKLESYVQRCVEAFTRYNENVCIKN